MTIDEESSGVIDVTSMLAKPGDTNTYLMLNAQIHVKGGVTKADPAITGALSAGRPDLKNLPSASKKRIDMEAIEGGQFYTMTITDWTKVFN